MFAAGPGTQGGGGVSFGCTNVVTEGGEGLGTLVVRGSEAARQPNRQAHAAGRKPLTGMWTGNTLEHPRSAPGPTLER